VRELHWRATGVTRRLFKAAGLKTYLTIFLAALLLVSCAIRQIPTGPPLPLPAGGNKSVSAILASLAVPVGPSLASTGVVVSVVPPTNFTLYATSNLLTPRTNWTLIATGYASIIVPASTLNVFTNKPKWVQGLEWDIATNPAVAGYNLYYGPVSGVYTNHVNVPQSDFWTNNGILETNMGVIVSGLSPAQCYYAATAYSTDGLESLLSPEVSGMPLLIYEPLAVFFCATAPVKISLKITPQKSSPMASFRVRNLNRLVPPRQMR